MTIRTSSFGGDGGGGVRLAPDLDWPENGQDARSVVVDTSGGLTTVLNLSGKFLISNLYLRNQDDTASATTVKLTIDGTVIWNAENFTAPSPDFSRKLRLIGDANLNINTEDYRTYESIICNSSFLLEVDNPATNLTCFYHTRPIL